MKRAPFRCIFSLLILLLLTQVPTFAFNTTDANNAFTDIEGHWAQATIEKWAGAGILAGYDDGSFRPNNPVARSELAAILYSFWGISPVDDCFDYPDIVAGSWYYDSLRTMNMYGVAVNPGPEIRPLEYLTREEAIYMLESALLFNHSNTNSKQSLYRFSDWSSVSEQFRDSVINLSYNNFICGTPEGTLCPKSNITRAEVMTIINSIVDVYITEPGSYEAPCEQNIFIRSKDVTLTLLGEDTKAYQPRVILLGDATNGSVTIRWPEGEASTRGIRVYGVDEFYCDWNQDGEFVSRTFNPVATHTFPDTRFSGGQGTEDFPYLIETKEQFQLLEEFLTSDTVGLSSVPAFRLAGDLDLGTVESPIGIIPFNETNGITIHADLDGANHTLSYEMKLKSWDDPVAGLFYGWKGTVKNLNLAGTVDVRFSEEAPKVLEFSQLYLGGFAGVFSGSMKNCITTMHITGRHNDNEFGELMIGGLAGFTHGATFTDCTALGDVNLVLDNNYFYGQAGGLLGCCAGYDHKSTGIYYSGTFNRCVANGIVSLNGGYHTSGGGLLGIMTYGTDGTVEPSDISYKQRGFVRNSSSTATINSIGATFQSDCGGLVGHQEIGTIEKSWAKPTITVKDSSFQNIGSICGASYNTASYIMNCWADASGCGSDPANHTGGIVGRLASYLTDSYVLGTEKLGADNSISCKEWTDIPSYDCIDQTSATQEEKDAFFSSCDWDFQKVWDNSGAYPILRTCDADAQLKALGLK